MSVDKSKFTGKKDCNNIKEEHLDFCDTDPLLSIVKEEDPILQNNDDTGKDSFKINDMSEQPMITKLHVTERFALSYNKLSTMQKNQQWCDVRIIIGDTKILAHKVILASHSDYFKNVLMESNIENHTNVLEINNTEVTKNALKLLIEFIYTSHLTIDESNVKELLMASNFLLFNDVKQECLKMVKQTMNVNNFKTLGDISIKYKIDDLYDIFVSFVLRNFIKIISLKAHLSFSFKLMTDLLKSDDLFASEKQVYESTMMWLKHDINERGKYLEELIQFVRLNLLPIEYLDHYVQEENLIKSNLKCMNYLCDAYKAKNYRKIMDDGISLNSNFKRRKYSQLLLNTLILIFTRNKSQCTLDWITTENEIFTTKIFTWKSSDSCLILNDGRIVCINDSTNEKTALSIFDVKFNKWSVVAEFLLNGFEKKYILSIIELNEHVYLMSQSGRFMCIDLRKKKVLYLEGIAHKYYVQFGLTVSDGIIYMVGIYNVWKYNSITNKWIEISSTGYQAMFKAICSLNGSLYVMGGVHNRIILKSAKRFCTSSNNWSVIADMNIPRRDAGAVAVNGLVYIIGGENCSSYEIYDPMQNKWILSNHRLVSKVHYHTRATVLNSKSCINSETIDKYFFVKQENILN